MSRECSEADIQLKILKVAVSGHGGFIGRHLVTALQSLSIQPLLLDGDVRLPQSWKGSFDLLYHLAAVTPESFADGPGKSFSVNIEGTLQALEACRVRGARMVFISTCGVYSPSIIGGVSENSPIDPQTPYAESKLLAEMLCRSYAAHYKVPVTVLRLFNVFGEGQRRLFLVPFLLQCALEGNEAVVYHPHSSRDFVHVSDVVHALKCVVFQKNIFDIFNIGQGRGYIVHQVIETIEDILGRKLLWGHEEKGVDPNPIIYAEIERAKTELNWYPSLDLEQGLREIILSMGIDLLSENK